MLFRSSLFGSLATVADFAALSRLSLLFGFLLELVVDWFTPRIARCQDPVQLRRLLVGVTLGAPLLAAGLLVAAWFARDLLVGLLGKGYAGLTDVFPLALVQVGIGFCASLLYRICAARAWLGKSWILMVSHITFQIAGSFIFDVSTVCGALQFQIVPLFAGTLIVGIMMIKGMANDGARLTPEGRA